MAEEAPYGSWRSPISISMLVQSRVDLGQLAADGDTVYWTESRPQEDGRTVIVRRTPDGGIADVSPPGFDARTRAHEYGGGGFAVDQGRIISSSFADQRVYRLDGAEPVAITPPPRIPAGDRYADFVFHGDLVIAVRERHRERGEPLNTLVVFPVDGSAEPEVIAAGYDFYSSPTVGPDGTHLAWLAWNHPNMPWDGSELWLAPLDEDGAVSEPERVAGGARESIFQPEWSPAGVLHFLSDRTGWWNVCSLRHGVPGDLFPMEADFGVPQWRFGMKRYAFEPDGDLLCIYDVEGRQHLARLRRSELSRISLPVDVMAATIAVAGGRTWLVAASATAPPALVAVSADGEVETLERGGSVDLPRAAVSVPDAIEFPTSDGATAHAFYYAPVNPGFVGPPDERPPLLVFTHGGPTSQTNPGLRLGIQFWTSRGFAVVDVNYRGSSGFGRAYRDALRGRWGLVDTADCVAAARLLADGGHVDGERMAIRGGSAGGFTTLCALAFSDDFAAGASYYGVADLAALAEHTHKFESRYLDGLVGPYPEAEEVYRERSPVHHADGLSCPVILLQGLDDRVVPPEQAEQMAEALRAKGIPHALILFPGEGHGLRRAESIARAQAAELSFYGQVFDFTPADDIESVPLVNG